MGLPDALLDGEPNSKRTNNLRMMSYVNTASTGWSKQPPHQDPAWLALIIQSGPGLLTSPANEGAQGTRVPVTGHMQLLVLTGGRLAKASQGFYPAVCHGVMHQEHQPRYSWVLLYPCNACAYRDPDVKNLLIACNLTAAAASRLSPGAYSQDHVCSDEDTGSCRA